MQISGINSFDQDVLMLVSHTTTHPHKRVPFQVGSRIIDQIVKSLMEEELKSLSQSWKLAYGSTVLSKSSQASDKEFDLDQVKGKVIVTKEGNHPCFPDDNSERAHDSYRTSKTFSCVGGTIP